MPKDSQLPEEECPVDEAPVEEESVEAEAAQEEPALTEPAEPAPVPEEAEPAEEESAQEEPAPKTKPVRRAHPLWRGWWLALILLACFVLLESTPGVGLSWLKQPMRAFGGAILVGGSLGALPGFLKGRKPEKPAWKRCLLAVLAGFAWGVLA